MAEITDDSAWGHRKGSSKGKYPWDEWLDGKTRILIKGQDFDIPIHSMQTMVASAARMRQCASRTARLDDDRLMIQAIIG